MTSKTLSLNLGFLTLHGLLRGYLMTAGRRGACQPVPVWALQLAACPVLIRKGLPAPGAGRTSANHNGCSVCSKTQPLGWESA